MRDLNTYMKKLLNITLEMEADALEQSASVGGEVKIHSIIGDIQKLTEAV
jgi:hypothetical protein